MIDYNEIVKNLKKEEVKHLLLDLGAEEVIEKDNCFITNTICHNIEGGSLKLYYYFDRKIFVCYTECNDAFNIFTLIEKVKSLNGEEYNYYKARDYILNFLDYENIIVHEYKYNSITEKYKPTIHA